MQSYVLVTRTLQASHNVTAFASRCCSPRHNNLIVEHSRQCFREGNNQSVLGTSFQSLLIIYTSFHCVLYITTIIVNCLYWLPLHCCCSLWQNNLILEHSRLCFHEGNDKSLFVVVVLVVVVDHHGTAMIVRRTESTKEGGKCKEAQGGGC